MTINQFVIGRWQAKLIKPTLRVVSLIVALHCQDQNRFLANFAENPSAGKEIYSSIVGASTWTRNPSNVILAARVFVAKRCCLSIIYLAESKEPKARIRQNFRRNMILIRHCLLSRMWPRQLLLRCMTLCPRVQRVLVMFREMRKPFLWIHWPSPPSLQPQLFHLDSPQRHLPSRFLNTVSQMESRSRPQLSTRPVFICLFHLFCLKPLLLPCSLLRKVLRTCRFRNYCVMCLGLVSNSRSVILEN